MTKFEEVEKELHDIFYEMPEDNVLTEKEKQHLAKIIKKAIDDIK